MSLIIYLIFMSSCKDTRVAEQSVVNKLLSDPMRLEILSALSMDDWTVKDLAKYLRISRRQLNRQIAVLKKAGLLCWRKAGESIKYYVRDAEIGQMSTLLFSWWSEQMAIQPVGAVN